VQSQLRPANEPVLRRTWAVLEHQPDQLLGDYDLVQARNVRVCELAMVVDLAGEVGVVLLRRLEHDLRTVSNADIPRHRSHIAHPGAIAEFVRCQVDLAEASLAYEFAQCVVAHGLEVGRGEFTVAPSVSARDGSRTQAQRGVLLEELLVRVRKLLSLSLSKGTYAPESRSDFGTTERRPDTAPRGT
jgi:hypothetical protein